MIRVCDAEIGNRDIDIKRRKERRDLVIIRLHGLVLVGDILELVGQMRLGFPLVYMKGAFRGG